jgi:hypothetical protein
MKITRCARFENPANGYVLECHSPSIYALVFGPFAFFRWSIWLQGIVLVALTAGTFGLVWLLLPFFVTGMIRQHYLVAGWRELPADYYYLWGRPAASPPHVKAKQVAIKPTGVKPLMSNFDDEPPRYQL